MGSSKAIIQLYAILEAVADRIEMNNNVGEQRVNWNTLLLNSINMLTLAASTMAGVAGSYDGAPVLALKLSSTLLFSAATGMLLATNKIQPSQLAEEQRNTARLFKQLQTQIQIEIAIGNPSEGDVRDAIEKVLALDKAYPLPLLGGAMLEKFPAKFEAARWWPESRLSSNDKDKIMKIKNNNNNGWNVELEEEMRVVIEVLKRKDMEDYERLGNIALKINKGFAVSAPFDASSIGACRPRIFFINGFLCFLEDEWQRNGERKRERRRHFKEKMRDGLVPTLAGALATVLNSFEHGGQVGMVFEMYRTYGGFFQLLEETIEAAIEEKDLDKRENGDLFEMKMALQLGRSVSQLRELATKYASCRIEGREIHEFASKLF
ncbi:hypothetical protein GLYMA_01G134900v4 [Glycine max]|uniref:F-box protein n=1 Tax=Glycine max TaxID=3847 RepID=A0A0R0LH10_SOYBN|nr:hypothetical protein GLYMA_01G134900v4 [Glycine max]